MSTRHCSSSSARGGGPGNPPGRGVPPPPELLPPPPPPYFGPEFTGGKSNVPLEPEDGNGEYGDGEYDDDDDAAAESCTVPRTHDPDLLAAGYSQRGSCSPHLRFRGGVG